MVDMPEGRKLGGSVSPQFGVNCGVLQRANKLTCSVINRGIKFRHGNFSPSVGARLWYSCGPRWAWEDRLCCLL